MVEHCGSHHQRKMEQDQTEGSWQDWLIRTDEKDIKQAFKLLSESLVSTSPFNMDGTRNQGKKMC